MKNILMVGPPGFSPARQYRGEGVLERLPKLDPEIRILYPSAEEPWIDVMKSDLVFFMRSITEVETRIAETARRMGVPIWYDADDDYFNVPEDNPAHDTYRLEVVRDRVAWFMTRADFVTVSTADLARKYGHLRAGAAGPIRIIPNALDDYALPWGDYPGADSQNLITWRGGATHQVDLWDFAEQFWDFLDRAPESWWLMFLGFNPKFIRDGFAWRPKNYGERVKVVRYLLDYHAYMEMFRTRVKPWAHVVPLVENPFNRSKSNIAGLEAVYAGAVPIVPDWEEWQFPAALRYGKASDFAKLMEKATRIGPDQRRAMWAENARWVSEHHALSKVNRLRVRLVDEALGRTPVS